MKKIVLFLGLIFILCGCGQSNDKNLVKDLKRKVDDANAYEMKGTLEIYRNEDKYTYDIDSSYSKDDLFKVSLINKNNNHEQIILRNKEGIYVITPSLNKSFKFQSDWPYNNSQIYLLQPVISDLSNDKNIKIEKNNNGYVLTSKVNYSSEKDFVSQKVYLDPDKNITKIEVLDSNGNIRMKLSVIDIDYKAKFDSDYFDATTYQKSLSNESSNDSVENSESTSKITDILYPMYVPIDTQLSGQDIVETTNGERVILTFTGESAFTVVQETLSDSSNVNYVYGDPYLVLDTVGSITDYSVSWISNGVEYSVMSDTMDIDELLTVAQSITLKTVGK